MHSFLIGWGFQEKDEELLRLREELEKVNARDLETLMEEVIDERKEDVCQPIRDDRINWWHRENVVRVEHQRKLEEKQERARQAQRK